MDVFSEKTLVTVNISIIKQCLLLALAQYYRLKNLRIFGFILYSPVKINAMDVVLSLHRVISVIPAGLFC